MCDGGDTGHVSGGGRVGLKVKGEGDGVVEVRVVPEICSNV
jgi:hypothetical protein